jgi:hypothetical protein
VRGKGRSGRSRSATLQSCYNSCAGQGIVAGLTHTDFLALPDHARMYALAPHVALV